MDLVIHGTDALLVDMPSLEKNDGTIQTRGDDNGGATCLSSDPAAECWPDISNAGYARRGVSFSMDGSWTDIGFSIVSQIHCKQFSVAFRVDSYLHLLTNPNSLLFLLTNRLQPRRFELSSWVQKFSTWQRLKYMIFSVTMLP